MSTKVPSPPRKDAYLLDPNLFLCKFLLVNICVKHSDHLPEYRPLITDLTLAHIHHPELVRLIAGHPVQHAAAALHAGAD